MSKEKIHFVGICGTLMGNIAVCLSEQGYEVRGSDNNFYPPMSQMLNNSTIHLYKNFNETNLDWHPDLVVIGNAISRGNVEAEKVLNSKLNFISLPALIKKYLLKEKEVIAVTGTHGKTTTTTLLAQALDYLEENNSFVIGGIPKNSQTGFKYQSKSKYFTLEGDEYDTAFFDKRSKFIHYSPDFLLINNIEFDHGDIFENIAAVRKTFIHLLQTIPSKGFVVANGDNENVHNVLTYSHSQNITFGKNLDNDFIIEQINYLPKKNQTEFIIKNNNKDKFKNIDTINFLVPFCGEYQVYNYTGAFLILLTCGYKIEKIKEAFNKFTGVKKRHELKGNVQGCIVLEDFAHHPTAIKVVIEELKQKYPNKKILVAFEPRSNTTRRNIFQNELSSAFSLADKTIIGQINREHLLQESEKLNIPKLLNSIISNQKEAVHYNNSSEIAEEIKKTVNEDWVCVVMSNGSFNGLTRMLVNG